MSTNRRKFLAASAGLTAAAIFRPAIAQTKRMRFAVGPLLPTPEDTKKAFMPIFAHLATELGVDYDLAATTDWAGLAVAMGGQQVDIAWMGPWGYIIANNATNCQAVATVKYDDKPIYYAIIIARPDLQVSKFPDSTKGKSIAFTDVGSTSGWLIPTYYAKEVWKIDPKTFWTYSEGSTHASHEIAVSAGQVDLATDFDRNRNAMIAAGNVKEDSNKIVWTSDPLPNDAIALPADAPKELMMQVQRILTSVTPEQAKALLPARYTGFVAATHIDYAMIEKAGIAVGKIKAKA